MFVDVYDGAQFWVWWAQRTSRLVRLSPLHLQGNSDQISQAPPRQR